MSEFNVGDKVMMMDEFHANNPEIFPPKGTIGVVVKYSSCDETVLVNWGKGSGVKPNVKNEYTWWCSVYRLEKVSTNVQEEDVNMNKFNIGDKVVFINAQKHKAESRFYPAVGTAGTVKKIGDVGDLLVDWGDAEGVDISYDGAKLWWCTENDIKPYVQENNYTDDEVWGMLKPKMSQLALPRQNIDYFSQEIKNMIVAAYRSGYGRATKGRSFIIKPKVDEKPSVEKSIDNVLSGKMIVTFYTDLDNSYTVSKFDHALHSEQGMEIHGDIIYDSDGQMWVDGYDSNGGAWIDGFDVIGDPDCEMYVAIPLSEAVEQFYGKFIKMMYCGDKQPVGLYYIKQWAIGEFNGFTRFDNETCAFMVLKHEDNNSLFYIEIHSPDFKALIPICDYLKHEGVNV